MSHRITITLEPDTYQVQLLLKTMRRYNDLCNFISQIVFEKDQIPPINLYYWESDSNYPNLYQEVRAEFPDINSNLIPIAFRKVGKAYKNRKKDKPPEAYQFNGTINYSNYLITIKFIIPAPDGDIGMLTISTLTGRQSMHFMFNSSQRTNLCTVFSSKKFREYDLTYEDGKFLLSTSIKEEPID